MEIILNEIQSRMIKEGSRILVDMYIKTEGTLIYKDCEGSKNFLVEKDCGEIIYMDKIILETNSYNTATSILKKYFKKGDILIVANFKSEYILTIDKIDIKNNDLLVSKVYLYIKDKLLYNFYRWRLDPDISMVNCIRLATEEEIKRYKILLYGNTINS